MKNIRINKRFIYVIIIIALCFSATSVSERKVKEKETEKEVVSGKAIVVEEVKHKEAEKQEIELPEETEVVNEAKAFMPQYPISGEIIKEFSDGVLVYSETLKDYRVHNGVDIKAVILEKVTAAEDGVIESVRNDALMGITVVIDHQNGVKTVYANLSSMDMVSEGEFVKKGEVINGAGDTALIETGQETHIHFEMIVDGKDVNPRDYIV